LLGRMGPEVEFPFERHCFYPAGSGRFCAEVHPGKVLDGIKIGEGGEIVSRRAIGVVANLPRHIAQREVETVGKMLNWGPEAFSVEESSNSAGPGNIVMIEIGSSEVTGDLLGIRTSRTQCRESRFHRSARCARVSRLAGSG